MGGCGIRKRQTALIEVVMAIVGSLSQMRARRATQIMEREVGQAVGDTQ